jgi:hypothetical protein
MGIDLGTVIWFLLIFRMGLYLVLYRYKGVESADRLFRHVARYFRF